MVWHFQHFYAPSSPIAGAFTDPSNRSPLNDLLWPMYEYGNYGVEFFWALSGFIFAHRYACEIASGSLDIGRFALQRLRRIGPVHYVSLLVVAAIQPIIVQSFGGPFIYVHNDSFHFLLNIVGASSWGFEKGYSFNGPFWSVSIEIPIYLLFFLMASRSHSSKWGYVFVLSLIMKSSGIGGAPLECLCYFSMGVLLQGSGLAQSEQTNLQRALTWLLLALLCLGVHSTTHGLRGVFLLLLICSLLVAFGCKSTFPWANKPLACFLSIWLGRLSYPVYLLHFPVQLFIVLVLGHSSHVWFTSSLSLLACYLLLTLAVAYLTFRYIEKPLQSLSKR